jgi:hypothetical protein
VSGEVAGLRGGILVRVEGVEVCPDVGQGAVPEVAHGRAGEISMGGGLWRAGAAVGAGGDGGAGASGVVGVGVELVEEGEEEV